MQGRVHWKRRAGWKGDEEVMSELVRLTAIRDMCRRYFAVGRRNFTADARSPSSAGVRRDADKFQAEVAPYFASKIAARNAYNRVINDLLIFKMKHPLIAGEYEGRSGSFLSQDETVMVFSAGESDPDEDFVTAEEAREIADDEVLRKEEKKERREARAARRIEKEALRRAKKAREDEDRDWATDDERYVRPSKRDFALLNSEANRYELIRLASREDHHRLALRQKRAGAHPRTRQQ